MSSRIYAIAENGELKHLVRAPNPAQAIRHVTANRYSAEVADQETLLRLLGDGVSVTDASKANGDA